jgi:hypothetical protein
MDRLTLRENLNITSEAMEPETIKKNGARVAKLTEQETKTHNIMRQFYLCIILCVISLPFAFSQSRNYGLQVASVNVLQIALTDEPDLAVGSDNLKNLTWMQYKQTRLTEWQNKGEFEKTADYEARIANSEALSKFESRLIADYLYLHEEAAKGQFGLLYRSDKIYYESYDADNEVVVFKYKGYNLYAKMPPEVVRTFEKDHGYSGDAIAEYIEHDDSIILKSEWINFGNMYYLTSDKSLLREGITSNEYTDLRNKTVVNTFFKLNIPDLVLDLGKAVLKPNEPYNTLTKRIEITNLSGYLLEFKILSGGTSFQIKADNDGSDRKAIPTGGVYGLTVTYEVSSKELDRNIDIHYASIIREEHFDGIFEIRIKAEGVPQGKR